MQLLASPECTWHCTHALDAIEANNIHNHCQSLTELQLFLIHQLTGHKMFVLQSLSLCMTILGDMPRSLSDSTNITHVLITIIKQKQHDNTNMSEFNIVMPTKVLVIIEWLHERTDHLDIFLFSAHHSMVFYF